MQLRTKQGRLTRYGLACGYREKTVYGAGYSHRVVILEMEHHVITVRTWVWDTCTRWQRSVATVRKARRLYAAKCKELKNYVTDHHTQNRP